MRLLLVCPLADAFLALLDDLQAIDDIDARDLVAEPQPSLPLIKLVPAPGTSG